MDLVGRYRIECRLGAGAFSTVWLAHDEALDIPVAVKVLSENWSHHADVRSRFITEARLLRRISSPQVVSVHDIGTLPDGRDYFVMDYAPDGTLADLCRHPIDRALALRLGIELARAVAVLHDHGILHRDLKPSNVLLERRAGELHPMLADLGMAKRLAEASGLTMAAGTPAYMAPEQARGMGMDERTDVYGAAAVCYRMLAGFPPYSSDDVRTIAQRSADRRPPALPATDGLSVELDALLRESLSADPDRRPPSASAFADRLETISHRDRDATVTQLPSATDWILPTPPSRPDTLDQWHLGPAALIGALTLMVCVGATTWALLSYFL